MEEKDPRGQSLGRGARAHPKAIDAARGHPGHAHFWERAFSRRQFIQTTGAAAGMLLLGSGGWTAASAAVPGATPKPIPGGFQFGDEIFHNFAPGVFDPLNTDRSGIFDFNGEIGYAIVDGTGTGRNTASGAKTPLFFETDLRFMKGLYVGEDGRRRHATFCLIWLDLFADQSDPTTQNHDFNPGIAENGLFWILRIPNDSVDADVEEGEARLAVKHLEIEDYGNLENALLDGPSVEANVSFDCRWHHPIARRHRIRNAAPDQQFTGVFTQTHATVQWSGKEAGFEFRSDPAHTSTTVYAEVGEERNGIFFS